MTFREVSEINRQRCNEWHKDGLEEWSVNDWATAMGGEAGEVLGECKKLRRIETGLSSNNPRQPKSREEAVEKIKLEIGDTYLYLDLLAQRLGINIEDAIRDTFNRVSEREGLNYKL